MNKSPNAVHRKFLILRGVFHFFFHIHDAAEEMEQSLYHDGKHLESP